MKVFFRTTLNQAGKYRPDWFSYEACFNNFLKEFKEEDVTVFFDGDSADHFVSKSNLKIVDIQAGSETKSFLSLIHYIIEQDYKDDEVIYIVEDDYLHREGSAKILQEAFDQFPNAYYITLYDHFDKYVNGYYDKSAPNFPIQILTSKHAHWRTTPSTTNTFATRFKTLKEDYDIHKEFSSPEKKTTDDHFKFISLWNKGRSVISCIPGYSTHVENSLMSPTIDWEKVSGSSLSVNTLDNTILQTR